MAAIYIFKNVQKLARGAENLVKQFKGGKKLGSFFLTDVSIVHDVLLKQLPARFLNSVNHVSCDFMKWKATMAWDGSLSLDSRYMKSKNAYMN